MTTAEHTHSGFEIPADYPDPAGRPVDHELLGQFVGAAFDGCTSCQDALLTLMVEYPPTTARLVELACVSTNAAFGGLPANLLQDGVPGPASPEFRQLARAGADGANTTMFTICEHMTSTERRHAANTAADILIGNLHLGEPGE